MAAVTNKHDEEVEGFGGQRNRFTAAEQQALLGRQNEVAKLENLVP
jgi:hypothetical protein